MQTLLAPPRQDLSEAVVLDALSLDHGPRHQWGVEVLDSTDKVVPGESIPVESGAVTWDYRPPDATSTPTTGAAEVRRRADFNLAGDVTVNLVSRRFRPWAELQASTGEWARFWLGVFVATNPAVDDDGIVVRRPLKLADKTYLYAHRFLPTPVTVPVGANHVQDVKASLTTVFGETSFLITSSTVTATEQRVFEAGLSYLAYYNARLEMAAFDALTVDEGGRPRSIPLADLAGRGPEVTYGPGQAKIVIPGGVEPLAPSLPNVVRFVARQGPSLPEEGNGIVTLWNESVGPASIDARSGFSADAAVRARAEVQVQVEVEAENQAELVKVANAEAQRYFAGGGDRFTGSVGLNPRMSDRDVVGLVKPRLGISGGVWLCTSWSYPLQRVTSESAVLMPVTFERRV